MDFTNSGVAVIGMAEFINMVGLVFIIGFALGMWALHFLRTNLFE